MRRLRLRPPLPFGQPFAPQMRNGVRLRAPAIRFVALPELDRIRSLISFAGDTGHSASFRKQYGLAAAEVVIKAFAQAVQLITSASVH
jgi:hypothetical protein